MTVPRDAMDASVPSAPRIYDYLLGGKDSYAADRNLADRLEAAADGVASVRELARVNRSFVLKAVQWAGSMLGIAQFLDLGCGLPSVPSVHDAARDGREGARVVYVDRDPLVVCHALALQSGPGLAAIQADVSDPGEVLGDDTARGLIDFTRPVTVVLGATLSAMPAGVAQAAVAGYTGALAAGSAVVISCASYTDPGRGEHMAGMFSVAGPWYNHTSADVQSFFGGLRLMRGKVADVRCWPLLPNSGSEASVIGGIGVKPLWPDPYPQHGLAGQVQAGCRRGEA